MPHPNQNGSLGCKSSHWDAASRAQWHWDANPFLLLGCTTGMPSKNWRRNAIGISRGCATSFGGCYALGMPVGCAKNNPGCHWDALKKWGCAGVGMPVGCARTGWGCRWAAPNVFGDAMHLGCTWDEFEPQVFFFPPRCNADASQGCMSLHPRRPGSTGMQ